MIRIGDKLYNPNHIFSIQALSTPVSGADGVVRDYVVKLHCANPEDSFAVKASTIFGTREELEEVWAWVRWRRKAMGLGETI